MINLANFSSIFMANWKLNGNIDFINQYYQKLLISNENCVVVCSSSIFLNKLKTNNKNLYIGAQDVSIYKQGSYTGELSATMLEENNVKFCLVGHSERRKYFNEKNDTVKIKASNLIENNIIPVICIGETLEEKEKKLTKEILFNQIEESIPNMSNYENTIIAYEPIWAIGTGLTPLLEEIEEIHKFIKSINKKLNKFKVLYGGSVNASNSIEINTLTNIDGSLIGGASLKVEEFNSIIS